MDNEYLWLKVCHIVSFTAWMAGLFYLPRLFVYHARIPLRDASYEVFNTMERRLLKIIMNPAMIMTFAFGGALSYFLGRHILHAGWFHAKLSLVLILAGFQGYLSCCHRSFVNRRNNKPDTFFRWLNEVPAVLLFLIVFLVVFKPF